MQVRGLLVAAVVLAALGGGVYWSEHLKKSGVNKEPADAPPKILSIPEDQFQQISLKKVTGQATELEKSSDGDWKITAPKPLAADRDAVRSLVSTLASLSSDRLVEENASDLSPFGLDSPEFEVSFRKADGTSDRLLVGDEAPTGMSYFVKLASDSRIFTIASYLRSSFDKTSSDLRDKRLLRFDPDKLSRVELKAKNQTVEFGRNAANEWQIVKPKPFRADNMEVEELVRKLRDAKMDLSAGDADLAKATSTFSWATPVATVVVTDAAGNHQMEIRKTATDYYVRSGDVEGVYKIGSDLGEALNKGIDDFRNRKLFDFGWTDPNKVEIKDGDKQYAFQKSGDKWESGGKQMDSIGVQELLDKLRELSATRFLEHGFTTPILELTVTSGDGGKVEKVLVSQTGATFYARRDNEPSVYEVDAKIVEEIRKAAADVKEPAASEESKKS